MRPFIVIPSRVNIIQASVIAGAFSLGLLDVQHGVTDSSCTGTRWPAVILRSLQDLLSAWGRHATLRRLAMTRSKVGTWK